MVLFILATVHFSGLSHKPKALSAPPGGIDHKSYLPIISRPFSATCPEPVLKDQTDGLPSWGSTITLSPNDGSVWVVNPDSGTISVINPLTLTKVAEMPAGVQPWSLAFSPDGQRLYVLDRAGGRLLVVNVQDLAVCALIAIGPQPGQLALSPTGKTLYITVTNQDELVLVDALALNVSLHLPVSSSPFAIAVSDDGDGEDGDEKIILSHLFAFPKPGATQGTDDGAEGRVTVLDAGNLVAEELISLEPDAHGFPNQLASIRLLGSRAWIPHIRTAPALPNGLSTKVFAAVSELNLDQNQELFDARLLLNDQEVFGSPVNNPVEAVPSPDGTRLYVVLAGSNLVEVIDVSEPGQPELIRFLATGSNPRGMALSQDGRRGFVMNYLSRSITVLDLGALDFIDEVVVTNEHLNPDVLRGKILFNNASDPRMSQGSWTSCASCHPDGGSDGVTWMLPDGPRQTPPLWNAGFTLPWHWSATLDEAQDVEETIEDLQHGLGLAPGLDPPLLGQPNASRSADLDAMAAYLASGISPPAGPNVDGNMAVGRDIFISAGCAGCHGGPTWTSSALPGAAGTLDPDGNGQVDSVLYDVGSLNALDVLGQSGFDIPSLLGAGLTAPYLHDGSMPTLEALIGSGHPDPAGAGNGVNQQEIIDLADFLRTIDAMTVPEP